MTPFEAASHADPYIYYAGLRQRKGLLFDADLRLWIASDASAVEAILKHSDCRVRPLDEPVPLPIAQGAAGRIFGRLMRMNEGAEHQCPRMAIAPALASVHDENIAEIVSQVFESLNAPVDALNELMWTLPVSVMATLMGVPFTQLREVVTLTQNFVGCLSPLSDKTKLDEADAGATRLSQLFAELLLCEDERSRFMSHVLRECDVTGWRDRDALIANLIGLLSQTCEATAGLIGNTLIAIHRNPDLFEPPQQPARVAEWVAEAARHDCPIQNTRRFVAEQCVIEGSVLKAGDTVLLLLASANRDPCANPDPDNFLLTRSHRRIFSFGSGRHECPGQQLALCIASEAVSELLRRQPTTAVRAHQWRYLPSLNARIPYFHCSRETQQ